MMAGQELRMVPGYLKWKQLCQICGIDRETAVLVCGEDDLEWNSCAVRFLPYYACRKNTEKTRILVTERAAGFMPAQLAEYRMFQITDQDMDDLLSYYCLVPFSDRVVFLSKDKPRDNRGGMAVDRGFVTLDELICLGFYRLREVPANVS